MNLRVSYPEIRVYQDFNRTMSAKVNYHQEKLREYESELLHAKANNASIELLQAKLSELEGKELESNRYVEKMKSDLFETKDYAEKEHQKAFSLEKQVAEI